MADHERTKPTVVRSTRRRRFRICLQGAWSNRVGQARREKERRRTRLKSRAHSTTKHDYYEKTYEFTDRLFTGTGWSGVGTTAREHAGEHAENQEPSPIKATSARQAQLQRPLAKHAINTKGTGTDKRKMPVNSNGGAEDQPGSNTLWKTRDQYEGNRRAKRQAIRLSDAVALRVQFRDRPSQASNLIPRRLAMLPLARAELSGGVVSSGKGQASGGSGVRHLKCED